MIGRVDAEHVPGERRAGQALGDHAAVRRHRRVHVLGQPRVLQRDAGLLVAAHQPRAVPVGQGDRVHRTELADAGEQRERVVLVVCAPRRQCLFYRRHHHSPSELICRNSGDPRQAASTQPAVKVPLAASGERPIPGQNRPKARHVS